MHARPLSTDQACYNFGCLKALGTVASSKQALLTHSIPNCQLFIFSLTLHPYPSIVGRIWLFCAALFFYHLSLLDWRWQLLLPQAPWPACASPPLQVSQFAEITDIHPMHHDSLFSLGLDQGWWTSQYLVSPLPPGMHPYPKYWSAYMPTVICTFHLYTH